MTAWRGSLPLRAAATLAAGVPAAAMLVTALLVLVGCTGTSTIRNGVETPTRPPSAAAQEAARKVDLRARASAHVDLAAAYYGRGQYGIALEEIAAALQVDATDPAAWSLRGLVYMALREDRDAEESFRQGMHLAPADSELGNNYAYFLCERGRAREGLAHLAPVLRDPLYRTPEKALFNAAQCALRLDDTSAATQYLRQSVQLVPTDEPSATALAVLLERDHHPGEAREVLRPLLRSVPPPKSVLQNMIRLDEALQDPVQAGEHRALLQKFHAEPGPETAAPGAARP